MDGVDTREDVSSEKEEQEDDGGGGTAECFWKGSGEMERLVITA